MKKVKIIGADFTKLSKFSVISDDKSVDGNLEFLNSFLRFREKEKQDLRILDVSYTNESVFRARATEYSFFSEWDPNMSGNIVGVYQDSSFFWEENRTYYTVTLELRSRFDADRPFFLARMMSSILLESELKTSSSAIGSMDDIFDFLLVYRYKRELKQAYSQGLYRTYQKVENNDTRLKGAIDIARHLKLNMGMNTGNIAYSYRHQTVDNSLNYLFLHAYVYIENRFPQMARSILMSDVECKAIISKLFNECKGFYCSDAKSIVCKHLRKLNHPYYQKYETLRKTSIDILRRKGMSPFSNDESLEEVPYMLFYVADLWEYYILELIRKQQESVVEYEPEIEVLEHNDYFVLKTYPDYVIKNRENEEKGILDAKFIPLWDELFRKNDAKGNYSFLEKDYTKCLRDLVDLNVHKAGVVFPSNSDTSLVRHRISKIKNENVFSNQTNWFYTLSLKVVSSKEYNSYKEWEIAQSKEENLFLDEYCKIWR